MKRRIQISPERRFIVISEISEGSEPKGRFYIMVAVSTMIACFGLITNSTAVIIGAMLVAPLMTPIFGIALALIRSDNRLFSRALNAEIAGVVAAIAMGLVLGLLYPALKPTPEMIARTEPQLFDLFVAIFSGFAGAYALIDEKISPALPGVAIATAIVPPLANTGLCFSVGQYVAGVGSFLLFFANFLSILLVASAVFWLFGMANADLKMDGKTLLRRFGFPLLCFALVALFLTYTLVKIAGQHYLQESIANTLKKDLIQYPDTGLEQIKYNENKEIVYVLADIHSPEIMNPVQVDKLEKNLTKTIGKDIKLIVRSKVAKNISALDSPLELVPQKLDGSFTEAMTHPRVKYAKAADTLIRNYFAQIIGFEINYVRYLEIEGNPIIFASIQGISSPHPESIKKLEKRLQNEINLPDARLFISFLESRLYNNSGSVRLEFSGLTPNYPDDIKESVLESIGIIRRELAKVEPLSITGINYNVFENALYVLIDANSPDMLSIEFVKDIEQKVSDITHITTNLFINLQANTVVTSSGYKPYWSVARAGFQRQSTASMDIIKKLIESSR